MSCCINLCGQTTININYLIPETNKMKSYKTHKLTACHLTLCEGGKIKMVQQHIIKKIKNPIQELNGSSVPAIIFWASYGSM